MGVERGGEIQFYMLLLMPVKLVVDLGLNADLYGWWEVEMSSQKLPLWDVFSRLCVRHVDEEAEMLECFQAGKMFGLRDCNRFLFICKKITVLRVFNQLKSPAERFISLRTVLRAAEIIIILEIQGLLVLLVLIQSPLQGPVVVPCNAMHHSGLPLWGSRVFGVHQQRC